MKSSRRVMRPPQAQEKPKKHRLFRSLMDEADKIGRAAHNAAAAGAAPADSAGADKEEQKIRDYVARASTKPTDLPYRKGHARKRAAAKAAGKMKGAY